MYLALFLLVGEPDENAKANIANARAAGLKYVDVYMFPCPSCGGAAGQVKAMGEESFYGNNFICGITKTYPAPFVLNFFYVCVNFVHFGMQTAMQLVCTCIVLLR